MVYSSAVPVPNNRLLAALPVDLYRHFGEHLEPVRLKRGDVVYRQDAPIDYVYFPETCIISQLTVFADGSSIESGIVGREGLAGVSVALARTDSSREAFVQTPGRGYRMETGFFRRALAHESLYELVLGYGSVFFEQVAQAGACSNHHGASQRLARLLLMLHDRVEGDSLFITHDFVAQMLGIHRPSVTLAALDFKERGLINYARGTIRIEDRAGLEREACECYDHIRRTYRSYDELLEMRYLANRVEQLNGMLNSEMRRRRELKADTDAYLESLQRAVAVAKTARNFYALCFRCHQMRDEHGRWLAIEDFLESHLNTKIRSGACPHCR